MGEMQAGNMMSREREANHAWIASQNLSEFEGKWVGVVDQKLVESGDNAVEIVRKCREKYPKKTPFIVKVPKAVNITI